MGELSVTCPACRKKLKLRAAVVGGKITCPVCKEQFTSTSDQSGTDDEDDGQPYKLNAVADAPISKRKAAPSPSAQFLSRKSTPRPKEAARAEGAFDPVLTKKIAFGVAGTFVGIVVLWFALDLLPTGKKPDPLVVENFTDGSGGMPVGKPSASPTMKSSDSPTATVMPAETPRSPITPRSTVSLPEQRPSQEPSLLPQNNTLSPSNIDPRHKIDGFGGDRLAAEWKVVNRGTATGWDYALKQDRIDVRTIRGSEGYAIVQLTRAIEVPGEFDSGMRISWVSQEGPPNVNHAMQGLMLNFRDAAGNIVATCGYIDENEVDLASPISAIATPDFAIGPDTIAFHMRQYRQAVPQSERTRAVAPIGTANIRIRRDANGLITTHYEDGRFKESVTALNASAIKSVEIEFRRYFMRDISTFNGISVERFRLLPAAGLLEADPPITSNSPPNVPQSAEEEPAGVSASTGGRFPPRAPGFLIPKVPKTNESRKVLMEGTVMALDVSPDGKSIAAATGVAGSRLRVWQGTSAKPKQYDLPRTYRTFVLRYSPSGRQLAAMHYDTRLSPNPKDGNLDVLTIYATRDMSGKDAVREGPIREVAWHPEEEFVALARGGNPGAVVWDLRRGRVVAQASDPNHAGARTVAINSNGTKLATGYDDGRIRIWDLPPVEHLTGGPAPIELTSTVELVGPGDGGMVYWLAFNGDGSRLVASYNTKPMWAVQWDLESQSARRLYSGVCTGQSADGSKVLVYWPQGFPNGEVSCVVWSPDLEKPLSRCMVSGKTLFNHVRLTQDGKFLIGGMQDGTIRQWSLKDQPPDDP